MTDRRTPLGRVLGYGSAKEGTGHWWIQRVSGAALVLLGGWFAVSLALLPGFGHEAVLEWLRRPSVAVLAPLLVLTAAWHSHLGVQVVIEDYVHQPFARIFLLVASWFVHALAAAAGVVAVLRVAFGAAA